MGSGGTVPMAATPLLVRAVPAEAGPAPDTAPVDGLVAPAESANEVMSPTSTMAAAATAEREREACEAFRCLL